ncbi:hypothetical protein SAMN03159341_103359 [Paenibacillus sp. 1_12]|uniref:hypothetical protein n=1 Tax=Paenibacillus sp. 1_12 TaxID=1566278 RepID=UPI0008DF3834|nr:hypothetical protein [Paenibacillus sp. 1_12]SFL12512.1 hypothetical protein SAMN03159341_103359 [Paenibacillus sp. 1_12]
MDNINYVIKKVSTCITFGQPVSSGSVMSQRLSDPRIPISAYYMSMKTINEMEHYYHEVWLKKEGLFAITEAWYKDSSVSRKLLHDNLTFEQLKELYGEEEANSVILRMTEIIKKSEREDWRPQSRRS